MVRLSVNSIMIGILTHSMYVEIKAESGDLRSDPQAELTNKYKQIFGIREVHILSVFSLIYVGTEVTIGGMYLFPRSTSRSSTPSGWSVTYIQEKRHGTANAGYISSGFFAGECDRIIVHYPNECLTQMCRTHARPYSSHVAEQEGEQICKSSPFLLIDGDRQIGERRALFLYALLAIQCVFLSFHWSSLLWLTREFLDRLEVTVWVVPSLVENALAVAFVGLLLGPMYPILMNHSTRILPRWLLTGCMGYIAGVGQAGSAVLPFLTGLLASKFGIASLQPL